MKTRLGQLSVRYSARGIPTYTLELWHDGLKKHRLIRGEAESIVKLKAQLQTEEWAERWAVVDSRERDRSQKLAGKRHQEERKALAADRTTEAQQELEGLTSLLKATLAIDDTVDWESLKDKKPFPESNPSQPTPPQKSALPSIPKEPQSTDSKYLPSLGLLDKLIASRKERLVKEKQALFAADHEAWLADVAEIKRAHSTALRAYEKMLAALREEHDKQIAAWTARRGDYLASQAAAHTAVDTKRAAYESNNPEAITEYCDLVLASSRYPDYFPQEFDLDYDSTVKTLIVDYQLPSPDDLPRLKGVKYAASQDEVEELFLTDAQAAKLLRAGAHPPTYTTTPCIRWCFARSTSCSRQTPSVLSTPSSSTALLLQWIAAQANPSRPVFSRCVPTVRSSRQSTSHRSIPRHASSH